MVMELVNRRWRSREAKKGRTFSYALLVALIAFVAVAAITLTGTNVNAIFVRHRRRARAAVSANDVRV